VLPRRATRQLHPLLGPLEAGMALDPVQTALPRAAPGAVAARSRPEEQRAPLLAVLAVVIAHPPLAAMPPPVRLAQPHASGNVAATLRQVQPQPRPPTKRLRAPSLEAPTLRPRVPVLVAPQACRLSAPQRGVAQVASGTRLGAPWVRQVPGWKQGVPRWLRNFSRDRRGQRRASPGGTPFGWGKRQYSHWVIWLNLAPVCHLGRDRSVPDLCRPGVLKALWSKEFSRVSPLYPPRVPRRASR